MISSCATRGPASTGDCDVNHFEPEFLNELQLALNQRYGAQTGETCSATESVTIPGATGFKGHLKDSKSAYRKQKTELIYSNRDEATCEAQRAQVCGAATAAWRGRVAAR